MSENIAEPEWLQNERKRLSKETPVTVSDINKNPTVEQTAMQQLRSDAFRKRVEDIAPTITPPKKINSETVKRMIEKIKNI